MALPRGFLNLANGLRHKHASFLPYFIQGSRECSFLNAATDFIHHPSVFRNVSKSAFKMNNAVTTVASPLGFIYTGSTRNDFNASTVFQQNRQFHSSSCYLSQEVPSDVGKKAPIEKLSFHEGMGLRLVNENGFLSWCRNSYISTVAGVGMMNVGESFMAHGAASGVLFIAGMNMIWGSGSHINNLFRLRKVTDMSRTTLFVNVFGTAFHGLLYVFLLLIFSGFFGPPKKHRHGHRGRGEFGGHEHDRGPFRGFDQHKRQFGEQGNPSSDQDEISKDSDKKI